MLSLLTYNSFSQNVDVKGLLDKPETRTEIFNTIVGDHELIMDFMKVMRENEHATMMMKKNPEMMQKTMVNMMEMCDKDSAMRYTMVDMMTQYPEMMKAMMQKMNEKGMIKMDNVPMMENQGDEKELLHKR
jgi:spore coat polysaccharide biosynthesis protein SpsF (cytidylyltransferase family)